jgi:L-alanine-DL-glutamate epimerase-like enolase superfamily enzyme
MRVTRIQIAQCAIPLPRPIKLGPTLIATRDFVAVRACCADGSFGDAIGYPRGSALFDEARVVSDFYLGSDPFMRRQSWEAVGGRLVNTRAANLRAMSLFDIAMADVVAKQLQQPVFRLLGGLRESVPVMAVAGYYLNERPVSDVVREVSDLIDAGYQRVKIMLSGSDPQFDLAYAKAISDIAPGRIAVDAHWSWASISEAYDTCRRLDDLGLVFIEDPFGPSAHFHLGRLAAKLRTPLAAGEDMPGQESLGSIADVVGRLRVDATTCGGLNAALGAAETAASKGVAVLPHVFPTLHAQLAGALHSIEMVEEIPHGTGADPLHELLVRDIRVVDGQCQIDQEPGAGMGLDWEQVSRYLVRSETRDLN